MTIVLGQHSFDAESQCLHEGCLHHGLVIPGHEYRLYGMSCNGAPSEIRRVGGVLTGMEHDEARINGPNLPLHHPAMIILGRNERSSRPSQWIIDRGFLSCAERHCNATQHFFNIVMGRSRSPGGGCTQLLRE